MAEVLLRQGLGTECGIEVASAGLIADGTPPPSLAVEVMGALGAEIAGRPSVRLDPEALAAADLVVTMTRQQLIKVATLEPSALKRSFTFSDLVSRADRATGRLAGEGLAEWATRLSAGRTRESLLTDKATVEVPDPMGGTRRDFEAVHQMLTGLVSHLTTHLEPTEGFPKSSQELERHTAIKKRGIGGVLRRR
jgi:protein-tyrosine phosphatase